jgi:Ala-tRNA(Pro) deacylase
MSIAPTLQRYFTAENIQYDVIPHDPTMSSARTAEACRISGDRLAKAIVLRRNAGYMLAVLPASHHLRLSDLRDQLGDNVEMANESEIDPLFPDCAHGSVSPFIPNLRQWKFDRFLSKILPGLVSEGGPK